MTGTNYATSDRTKINIIEAAGELFAVSGVDAVSTREIAKRAGENIGSIHYHFGGKQKLAKAAFEHALTMFKDGEELEDILESQEWFEGPESKARLIREVVVHHLHAFFCQKVPSWVWRLVYLLMTDNGELGAECVEEQLQPHNELLQKMVQGIRPEMSLQEARAWVCCFMGQIAHPSLMQVAILRMSNESEYSREFLCQLCERIIENTTRGLGLPYHPWTIEDYCAEKIANGAPTESECASMQEGT